MAVIASAALVLFATPAVAADYFTQGEKAIITGTDGDGLNVRSAADAESDVHFVADEGSILEITDGPHEVDGVTWYRVRVDGLDAWVMAEFVEGATSSAGDQVKVVKTNGHGLRLRTAASHDASTKTVLPEGTILDVIGDEQTDESGVAWAAVEYNGESGYAHRGYLAVISLESHDAITDNPENNDEQPSNEAPADEAPVDEQPADDGAIEDSDDAVHDEPEADPEPEPEPAPDSSEQSGEVAVGGNARVVNTNGYGLNVRYGAGFSNGVVTVAAEGDVLQVIGGPETDSDGATWWNVDYRGLNGWVHGSYLEATDAEPTGAGSASGSESPDADGDSGGDAPAASPMGERIVGEAMRHLGAPYVWAGTTPAGFDCSGFIFYVVNQITGGGFPRVMEAQVNRGTYVPSDQLQPGDLVFQQNTYQWGLSHAGIYIGNGQFIHASTPGTGVIISNLWDSYWGPRYYTARRIS